MKNMAREFKEFIATGNMMELAVAVILGAAVAASIKAFTDGIMMQIVAAIFGKPNFDDVTLTLRKNVGTDLTDPANPKPIDSVLKIGTFINSVISLLTTGIVLFALIRGYNRIKRKSAVAAAAEAAVDPAPSEIELLTEIRNSLRQR